MTTGEYILCGTNIAMAIIMLIALLKKQDVKVQQPIDVKFVEQFASKHDFVGHVADNDHQRGVLHKRIDDVIKDYNDKFQALPNEIVTLLRNSGALRNFRRDDS